MKAKGSCVNKMKLKGSCINKMKAKGTFGALVTARLSRPKVECLCNQTSVWFEHHMETFWGKLFVYLVHLGDV